MALLGGVYFKKISDVGSRLILAKSFSILVVNSLYTLINSKLLGDLATALFNNLLISKYSFGEINLLAFNKFS